MLEKRIPINRRARSRTTLLLCCCRGPARGLLLCTLPALTAHLVGVPAVVTHHVAACREVLDELEKHRVVQPPQRSEWADKVARKKWPAERRLAFARAAVRHVTHVAHHGTDVDPLDAKHMVRLAGLLLKYAEDKP